MAGKIFSSILLGPCCFVARRRRRSEGEEMKEAIQGILDELEAAIEGKLEVLEEAMVVQSKEAAKWMLHVYQVAMFGTQEGYELEMEATLEECGVAVDGILSNLERIPEEYDAAIKGLMEEYEVENGGRSNTNRLKADVKRLLKKHEVVIKGMVEEFQAVIKDIEDKSVVEMEEMVEVAEDIRRHWAKDAVCMGTSII